jgi:hypothetical protein
MVIVELQGGLGNQMFQYAFASILANNNNVSIKINKKFFDLTEKKLGFTPRNFELGIFNNSYLQASELDIISLTHLSNIIKLKRKLGINNKNIYEEPTFDFQDNALSIKTPVYLKGYFQSYKYFIGFENHIKKIFSFPVDKLDNINKKILLTIKSSTTIAVHIRRGDYINDKITQQFHGNCGLEYYLDAISLFASKNKDFTLLFFSDDCDWVKEKFENLPYPKLFLDHNKNENSWKDMFLMSSCNHNIIANSSFSWWAAWLNENLDKIVIAPKEWFKTKDLNIISLLPEEWIKI